MVFLFNTFDATGLFWAIEQAMLFFNLPGATKSAQIERVMEKSALTYTHANTARRYIELYEEMLQRPLIAEKKPDIPRDTD